jgi:hypothetical protein
MRPCFFGAAVELTKRWKCGMCGEWHDELPMCFGPNEPSVWWVISEEERARSELTQSQCVIEANDEVSFYVRGHVQIPVRGLEVPFTWNVWASLSEQNFLRTCELWETEGRESEPPYFGWLCTHLPFYPETMYLKTHVHTSPMGLVPLIELEPTDHPLAVDQREGIEFNKMIGWIEKLLHE